MTAVGIEALQLPAIRSSIPIAVHPSVDQITGRGLSWLRRFVPFVSDADRAAFIDEAHCQWVSLLFPAGPEHRIQDICDLTLLLFATDDAFIHGDPEILDRAVAIMGGDRTATSGEWAPGLCDIWTRLEARMPPRQLERVRRGIVALYDGAGRELACRREGMIPQFEEYMRIRHDSVGARIYLVLAEYAMEADLSPEVAACRGLRALHDITAEHLILTNDVFSFRKEHEMGDTCNAVAVLHRHSGLGLQRIVDDLGGLIADREREFLLARDELLCSSIARRRGVRRTLEALGFLLSGNLHWSRITSRYHR